MFQILERNSIYIASIIIIMIMYFIVAQLDYVKNEFHDGSDSFTSTYYNNALVSSIGVAIPLIVDILHDYWSDEKLANTELSSYISRFYLLIGFMLTMLGLVNFTAEEGSITQYWYLTHIQILICITAMIGYIQYSNSTIWTTKKSLSLFSLFSLAIICRLLDGKILNLTSILGISFFVAIITGFTLLTILSFSTFIQYIYDLRADQLKFERHCSMFYVAALFLGCLFNIILMFRYANTKVQEFSQKYLVTSTILLTAFVYLVSMSHSRRGKILIAKNEVFIFPLYSIDRECHRLLFIHSN